LPPTPDRFAIGAVLAQVVDRAEAGQHQQLRRVDRTAGKDHLAGLDAFTAMAATHLHADGATLLDQHTLDQRMRAHMQVAALAHRLQEGRGRRTTCAVALGDLVQPEAGVAGAIEVVVAGVAGAGGCIDQRGGEFVVMTQVGDAQRSAGAVPVAGTPAVVLAAQEPRQHLCPRPARIAGSGRPAVVVARHAAYVAHGIDRAGAAQGASARPPQASSEQSRLRLGDITPVQLAIVGQPGDAGGHVEQRVPVGGAGFQQQDAAPRRSAEPVGQHATGRAGTHDHIVVVHRFPP
jgi:hypothetical protein